jgi:hypothetical protein
MPTVTLPLWWYLLCGESIEGPTDHRTLWYIVGRLARGV